MTTGRKEGSEAAARIVEYLALGGVAITPDEAFVALQGFLVGLSFGYARPTQAGMLFDRLHAEVPDLPPFPSDEFDAFLRQHGILPPWEPVGDAVEGDF